MELFKLFLEFFFLDLKHFIRAKDQSNNIAILQLLSRWVESMWFDFGWLVSRCETGQILDQNLADKWQYATKTTNRFDDAWKITFKLTKLIDSLQWTAAILCSWLLNKKYTYIILDFDRKQQQKKKMGKKRQKDHFGTYV